VARQDPKYRSCLAEEESLGIAGSRFFTGRMPFLSSNQKSQSTEELTTNTIIDQELIAANKFSESLP